MNSIDIVFLICGLKSSNDSYVMKLTHKEYVESVKEVLKDNGFSEIKSSGDIIKFKMLKNPAKDVVLDYAYKLKGVIDSYYELGITDTLAGFTEELSLCLPDVKVDTTVTSSVTAATDDDVHICLDNNNLKNQTWNAIVYTKYYKCTVTVNYNTADKTYSITVGSVEKF